MKNLVYIFSLLSLFVLAGCSHNEAPTVENSGTVEEKGGLVVSEALLDGNYAVDINNSIFAWSGEMIAIKTHTGTIDAKSGFFNIQDGKVIQAELIIDMSTIKSDEGLDSLVTHLASADFFDAEQYPETKLTIKSVESKSGDEYIVRADLTIKEKTNQLEFDAKIKTSDNGIMELTADFEIDRTLWDVRYGSDKFFDNLEDKIIKDEIAYTIFIKAIKR